MHRADRARAACCGAPTLAGALVLLLAAAALGPRAYAWEGDAWLPTQPLVEGKRVLDDKGCAHCHPIASSGNGERIGPDLARTRSWQDLMQLAASLWNHAPAMAGKMQEQGLERPTLSPDEMGKLAAYLFYLNFLDQPGDVERGRQLFAERSCARCHQLGGHGGTVGPRLDELGPEATSLFMAQALWNHGPQMTAKMAELGLDRPRLEGDDLAHILAFIRGRGTAAPLERIAAQCGSPRAGRTLLAQKGCLRCHAIAGAGGTVGPDLGTRRPGRNVTEMAGALWNHGPSMWTKMAELGIRFPQLTDREMADLLAYLFFVQYTADGGDAARGGRLFEEKSCAGCHAAGHAGPTVGPDLAASEASRSPLHWAAEMWNHAPAMAEAVREWQLAWPRFEDDEMRDLVAFVRGRREGSGGPGQ